MAAKLRSSLTATNIASVIAGAALLAAPPLAGFADNAIASRNAWASGLLILSFTLAAVLELRDWKSWMNVVPALWTMLSPWLLGFAAQIEATVVHVAVGLSVSILGFIELCRTETLCLDD